MKIALAQMPVVSGEPAKNFATMERFIAAAAEHGVRLVIFPEMSDTGYDLPKIRNCACDWRANGLGPIQGAAKKYQIHVVAGLSEKEGESIFNTLAAIDSTGRLVGKYRKTHLVTAAPIHEEQYVLPGDDLVVVEFEGAPFGLMTCYDIRFPEVARRLTDAGAKVLVIPAAFPLVRLPHWEALAQARAIENQVFVAAVSRVGSDGGMQFCGSSKVIDPYGVIVAAGSPIHEGLVVGDLNFALIEAVRAEVKVHYDRRPDLYARQVIVYR